MSHPPQENAEISQDSILSDLVATVANTVIENFNESSWYATATVPYFCKWSGTIVRPDGTTEQVIIADETTYNQMVTTITTTTPKAVRQFILTYTLDMENGGWTIGVTYKRNAIPATFFNLFCALANKFNPLWQVVFISEKFPIQEVKRLCRYADRKNRNRQGIYAIPTT